MSIYEQAADEVRRNHYPTLSVLGWGCSCGAGRTWPLAPAGRARTAVAAHQKAEVRKAAARMEQAAETESETNG